MELEEPIDEDSLIRSLVHSEWGQRHSLYATGTRGWDIRSRPEQCPRVFVEAKGNLRGDGTRRKVTHCRDYVGIGLREILTFSGDDDLLAGDRFFLAVPEDWRAEVFEAYFDGVLARNLGHAFFVCDVELGLLFVSCAGAVTEVSWGRW